nr:hypothetical protein F55C9.2 - Caenorhabditis elegans [Caenorhabditis elegans]
MDNINSAFYNFQITTQSYYLDHGAQ